MSVRPWSGRDKGVPLIGLGACRDTSSDASPTKGVEMLLVRRAGVGGEWFLRRSPPTRHVLPSVQSPVIIAIR